MKLSWIPVAGCILLSISLSHAAPRPQAATPSPRAASTNAPAMTNSLPKTDAQWRQKLTAEQYRVLRQKGTERAFTGRYWNHRDKGVYLCAGCGQPLFTSDTKFNSGCGWPSYFAAAATNAVTTQTDTSLGMRRTEVLCSRCGGHLGHVFDDGPRPTGLRYCINSASLTFEKKDAPNPAPRTSQPRTLNLPTSNPEPPNLEP